MKRDSRFDIRHGWNDWLTEEDVYKIKKQWEGKGTVTVSYFDNDGKIDCVHISVEKTKINKE